MTFDTRLWLEVSADSCGKYHAAHRVLRRKDGAILAEFFDSSHWYWELKGVSGKVLSHQLTPVRIDPPDLWANLMMDQGHV